MNEENIRNQHYVWRHYLKPWTEENKIWCVRDKKPFKINTEKIVKEDYYYRIDELNKNEKKFLELFIANLHPSGQKIVNKIYTLYNILAEGDEFIRNNAIEKYQASIECKAIPILEKIYKDNLSFWGSEKEKGRFCHFIGMQYTRTKKIQESYVTVFEMLKNEPGNPGDIDPIKTGKVLSLFLAEIIGNWVYTNTKPVLIDANMNSFLTSDQPIYNLKVDFNDPFGNLSEFEIFYPITPKKAIIFQPYKNKDFRILNIDEYNKFIIRNSREYVFSHSKDFIMKYY